MTLGTTDGPKDGLSHKVGCFSFLLHDDKEGRRLEYFRAFNNSIQELGFPPFSYYYMSLDLDLQKDLAGDVEKNVIFCTFDGISCMERLKFRIHPAFGSCWEFMAKSAKKEVFYRK